MPVPNDFSLIKIVLEQLAPFVSPFVRDLVNNVYRTPLNSYAIYSPFCLIYNNKGICIIHFNNCFKINLYCTVLGSQINVHLEIMGMHYTGLFFFLPHFIKILNRMPETFERQQDTEMQIGINFGVIINAQIILKCTLANSYKNIILNIFA